MTPSVNFDRLQDYVQSSDWNERDTLVKTHFPYSPSCSYLDRDDVRVLVSFRNIPDSVISWFHHQARLGQVAASAKDAWLGEQGRACAKSVSTYRRSWRASGLALMLPYEKLVDDPETGIASILKFLGKDQTAFSLAEIARQTQVRLKPGEAPRDGNHVRTAGRSVATEEIPQALLREFLDMEADMETGLGASVPC